MPISEPLRSRIMDVRQGRVPLDEVDTQEQQLQQRLRELVDESPLGAEPDIETVDAFLVERWDTAGL